MSLRALSATSSIFGQTSKVSTLQREKDQAREVKSGYDCGMTIESFPDIKEKDIIEVFEVREVKRV